MKLSVLIPAHNEEHCIEATLRTLYAELKQAQIDHELVAVNDGSQDRTGEILTHLKVEIPTLQLIDNLPPNGFGMAVRAGLENFSGDAVAIFMADASDDPRDLVRFFKLLETTETDCVFGSRFLKGSKVIDYPVPKLILNRISNAFIRILFGLNYNDTTNAFKLYRRTVIEGLKPFLSRHFNLTVELPLKAMIRGYRYTVIPNSWTNRKTGISKFKIKEMGSRYLFIVLYCFIEKWLSRGDYRREFHEEYLKKC